MMLVRRNSHSALTRRNTVEILQDAAEFYPRMMEDMRARAIRSTFSTSSGARMISPNASRRS